MSHIPEERNDHWTQAITTILAQSHNNILIFIRVLLCYMHFFKKFKWTLPTEGLSLENTDARKLEFKNDRFPSRSSLCYVGILIKGWHCHSPPARHMGLVSPDWDLIFTFSTLSSHPTPSGSKLCLSSVNTWGESPWGIMEEQNSGLIAFTTNWTLQVFTAFLSILDKFKDRLGGRCERVGGNLLIGCSKISHKTVSFSCLQKKICILSVLYKKCL